MSHSRNLKKTHTKRNTYDKKTKVNLDSCSPSNKNNSTTCFDLDSLIKIAKGWNLKNPENKINITKYKTRHQLWSEIDKRLNQKCDSEWCWIEQEFVKRLGSKELKSIFRPKMPRSWKKNKYEWLNTTDIETVMKQYEKKYSDFKFIGPVPIDFDYEYSVGQCIVNELCNLKIKNLLKNKISRVGIIYNLDPHDKPGSHWVAMYMDLNKKKVYYFDSYGTEPPDEVKKLVDRIQEQGREMGMEIEYDYNTTRHQYQNSECGVYSMYFITQLLEGKKTFDGIEKSTLKDEFINSKRKYYYLSD
jgi:hypothetical protein